MNLEESKQLIEVLMKTNEDLEKENIALEMEVKASQKIIQKYKRDTKLLEEYEEAIIDKDDAIRKFEKGKTIAERVIKSLKEKLDLQGKDKCDIDKILKEKDELNLENKTLEKEIIEIQKENVSKEENLEAIKLEMKVYEEKLLKLEEKKAEEKNVQTDVFQNHHESEILAIECDCCSKKFKSKSDLKRHMKETQRLETKNLLLSKLQKFETELLSEKFHLSIKLAKLKEQETNEKNSCKCRSFCRIFHAKHYWKKSESDQILNKMKDLQA